MNSATTFLLMAAAFVALPYGARLLISGALALAVRYGLGLSLATLLIVAFGTSLPELAIALTASSGDAGQIVVGNLYGSGIANVLFTLSIAALSRPWRLNARDLLALRPDVNAAFSVAALSVLLAVVLPQTAGQEIGFRGWHGVVLLVLFLGYMAFRIRSIHPSPDEMMSAAPIVGHPFLRCMAGLLMLSVGGHFIVEGVHEIRYVFGLGEGFVAATLVSLGTTMPELTTAVTLARRGRGMLAVTDVVGSNLFNIGFVLALAAMIAPLELGTAEVRIMLLACLATGVLGLVLNIFRGVGRPLAVAMLAGYFIMVSGMGR